MKKLSMVDKGFLLAESREMPMHVGGVSLFTLPDGVDEQAFLHDLAHTIRDTDTLLPPFGDRLRLGRAGLMGNAQWEPDPALDMEYHVRHSALPKPGRYRELFTLVSRLHGTLLERSRPLWEMHLIEGLQNRQFAVYTKTHHAAVDGARSVHISRSMLSPDPNYELEDSPLSLESWRRYKDALQIGQPGLPTEEELRNVADRLKSTFDSSTNLLRALRGFTQAWTGRGGDLVLPHLRVPGSVLNSRVDGARRFVAQSWPFARIHALGKAFGGTFNDAVLGMCAGALRTYLSNHAELPDKGLKAMVPVSLRQKGDVDSGNAVAAISADLSTHIADPAERMRAVMASVQAGKAFYQGMSPKEVELVSMLMQSPSALLMPLGLIPRLPPYNVAISNVPGIRETMYWNGARMDGSYPLSIVTDGMAMNITLVTYGENVDFGIIACRRSLPQVQRIIDYMEDALCELEMAAGFEAGNTSPAGKPKATKRVKAASKKAKTGAKT
ncbi:WS/DGAT/MGAT family acyltransferase [Litorivivens lipolytica]|uniref:diacylglycerol O-acyltransferase n=1 Tax=Litorivivens lipolytica TaxID=1524264 RepID=A0A7W4W3Y4_9GAMM|nr:wax ester/triacylglycerol synthase family O-acyltransferase [Litorivivens lipolytica]MBB3047006.1 WS/DGAT/MGAT family acyltransferase [Litorivivens lipolytica]